MPSWVVGPGKLTASVGRFEWWRGVEAPQCMDDCEHVGMDMCYERFYLDRGMPRRMSTGKYV